MAMCTLDDMLTSEFATPSRPLQEESAEKWPVCLEVQGYYAYQDSRAGTPVKELPDPNPWEQASWLSFIN